MNSITRLGLFAIVAAVGMASPAFAQTSHQHDKLEVRRSHGTTDGHQSGLYDFAAVPRNIDDPAITGGGSIGYNESLRNNQW